MKKAVRLICVEQGLAYLKPTGYWAFSIYLFGQDTVLKGVGYQSRDDAWKAANTFLKEEFPNV